MYQNSFCLVFTVYSIEKYPVFLYYFEQTKRWRKKSRKWKHHFSFEDPHFFVTCRYLLFFFVYFSQTKRRIPKRREKKGTRSQKKSKNDQNFVWHKRYLCGFLATLPFLFDPDGYFLSTRWGKINPFQLCFSHKINVISFYRGIIWFWAFVTELQWRPSSPIL